MTDFPDEVWIGSDDEMGAIHLEEDESLLVHYDDARKYIRYDLVPRWQPIETVPDGETVIALDPYGRASVVTKNNESKDFPVEDKSAEASYAVAAFTHWMPIPKVPEWIKNEKR